MSRSAPAGREIITLSALDFDSGNMISYRLVLTVFNEVLTAFNEVLVTHEKKFMFILTPYRKI